MKQLRKVKGLTQEELAIRLNVVRQTISKWEKGLSVPDAEILIKMAEIFEVSVSNLLGSKIESELEVNAVADQLARINEQLAIKNRRAHRIWKTIGIIIIAIIAINIILITMSMVAFNSFTTETTVTTVTDTIISEEK